MRKLTTLLALAAFLTMPALPAFADFDQWRHDFMQRMAAEGISPATQQLFFARAVEEESVVRLDQKQPESQITFEQYLSRQLPKSRIEKAVRLYHENRALLDRVSRTYGVPAPYIVALWGMESGFGANPGNYDTLSALATLAYEGRRGEFFAGELITALRLVDEGKVDPNSLTGSWAGAMGQCQFMPSSFRRYAVDFDGNGRADIWESLPDVFASIANYLSTEGWDGGTGWGREVRLTHSLADSETGRNFVQPLSYWAGKGVRRVDGQPLPKAEVKAALIQPDGPEGRAFLAYPNYMVLLHWNRSTYFATTVGLLANAIAAGAR